MNMQDQMINRRISIRHTNDKAMVGLVGTIEGFHGNDTRTILVRLDEPLANGHRVISIALVCVDPIFTE